MNLGGEWRALRTVLMVFGAIVLLFGGYYAYWQYQYQRSQSEANAFCSSAAVGSDISDAVARLEPRDRVRHGFQENETRYVSMFPGPIFNAFACEIELAGRKVTSKRVIEMQD